MASSSKLDGSADTIFPIAHFVKHVLSKKKTLVDWMTTTAWRHDFEQIVSITYPVPIVHKYWSKPGYLSLSFAFRALQMQACLKYADKMQCRWICLVSMPVLLVDIRQHTDGEFLSDRTSTISIYSSSLWDPSDLRSSEFLYTLPNGCLGR